MKISKTIFHEGIPIEIQNDFGSKSWIGSFRIPGRGSFKAQAVSQSRAEEAAVRMIGRILRPSREELLRQARELQWDEP